MGKVVLPPGLGLAAGGLQRRGASPTGKILDNAVESHVAVRQEVAASGHRVTEDPIQ